MTSKLEPPSSDTLCEQQLARLTLGRTILESVREAQREFGKKFVGMVRLRPDIAKRIDVYLEHDPVARSLCDAFPSLHQPLERLLQRFEELCRRRAVYSQSDMQANAAYRLLTFELLTNHLTLDVAPDTLVTATLLNSELIAAIPNETEFADLLEASPWLLHRSLTSNPANPREHLKVLQENINSILDDSEFREVHHLSGFITQLAAGNPSRDLKEIVRKAIAVVDTLVEDPELKDFINGRRGLAFDAVRRAGTNNARKYLTSLKQTFQSLHKKTGLERYNERPGYVLAAIMRYGQGAERFLLDALEHESTLQLDERFEELGPGAIRKMILRTPGKVRNIQDQ